MQRVRTMIETALAPRLLQPLVKLIEEYRYGDDRQHKCIQVLRAIFYVCEIECADDVFDVLRVFEGIRIRPRWNVTSMGELDSEMTRVFQQCVANGGTWVDDGVNGRITFTDEIPIADDCPPTAWMIRRAIVNVDAYEGYEGVGDNDYSDIYSDDCADDANEGYEGVGNYDYSDVYSDDDSDDEY